MKVRVSDTNGVISVKTVAVGPGNVDQEYLNSRLAGLNPTPKITASVDEPQNPEVGDFWIDLT